ncbi:anti-sigma factor family protein [Paracraurococcus lichenis]|uniref:Zf-HC2 domain-containing protein n=1 Tax=Paracraurococcus lichenis TaxID=3064888 RepID=A0ABT9DV26_9PROT|nr:zf-HC2 domain-containing protein [Paracraurococcus sp. LOR1-02]MDO9707751.1 zf-HC2 domain-containing protein [Paracraurococcus sp. LOR1-02]
MTEDCTGRRLLLQAELDGELDAGRAAELAAHVDGCAACAGMREALLALAARAREELPRYAAPVALRAEIAARLAPAAPPVVPPVVASPRRWRRDLAGFGLGAAMAAGLALVLLPRTAPSDPAREVLASHLRALQPGHLLDVVSSDRHTVKPWFEGRIDVAPPVRDLAAEGFPLEGGRLDYLEGRPVAALVYRRARHAVQLYVRPDPGAPRPPTLQGEGGYALATWREDGLRFWAVSDIAPGELMAFVDRYRAAR